MPRRTRLPHRLLVPPRLSLATSARAILPRCAAWSFVAAACLSLVVGRRLFNLEIVLELILVRIFCRARHLGLGARSVQP